MQTIDHAEEIEDVTDYYESQYRACDGKVVKAERKQHNVLVLVDHRNGTGARLAGDRKPRRWEVIYFWLSGSKLCQVKGSETTWWKDRELDPENGLFEQINCF